MEVKGPQSDIIQINRSDEASVRYTIKINGSEWASIRDIIHINGSEGASRMDITQINDIIQIIGHQGHNSDLIKEVKGTQSGT